MVGPRVRALCVSLATAVALAACSGQSGAPQSAAPAAGCARECLTGFVDRYVAALVHHDPKQAPFADNARFTENAQPLALGDGLWHTASAPPATYKLIVTDPGAGQAGFYLLMQENGNPIWLSGRLKVESQMITELETVVIRKGVGFGSFDRTAPLALWNEVVPPAERSPHDKMIEIANQYFDALDHHLTDSVPFDEQCNRIENGLQTTNNPAAGFSAGGPNVGALGCRENINSQMWRYITRISPRRFVVVDEERGIVQAIVMFHQDGSVASTNIPGYGEYKYSGAAHRPFTTVIPEMFKIKNGKILEIEATMAALPYGSRSHWD